MTLSKRWLRLQLLGFATATLLFAFVRPATAADTETMLVRMEQFIRQNGSLWLSPGASDALDTTGWKIAIDPEVTSRFEPEPAGFKEPAPAPLAPLSGNEGWDPRFGYPGYLGQFTYAFASGGGKLYAGGLGLDTTVAPLRTWDGMNWTTLASAKGSSAVVFALSFRSNQLFVGGAFSEIAGVPARGLARWDGERWTEVGGGVGGWVNALEWQGNDLIVGGTFTNAGTVVTANIARWNGTNWSALGSGIGPTNTGLYVVNSIRISGGTIYAGGTFTNAGAVAARNIASWNGTAWSALGAGLSGTIGTFQYPVQTIALSGGQLFVGGNFTTAGAVSAKNIARWDGSAWSALGTGANSNVYALHAATNGDLLVAGAFTNAGGVTASRIARWNGASWSALAGGVSATATALLPEGTNLLVGGNFAYAGGPTASLAAGGIARWDGANWSVIGTRGLFNGATTTVRALTLADRVLHVGGSFTAIGDISANRIARWDGTNWSTFGSGLNGDVNAIAVDGANVYAGGSFTDASGTPVNNIAMWDGNEWQDMGGGIEGTVNSLALGNGGLYAGGAFTNAGGVGVWGLGFWDGSGWTDVGGGFFGATINVLSLLVDGSDVIAGGRLIAVGAGTYTNLARWDGTTWNGYNGGLNSNVFALLKHNGFLYAGGLFTNAGGVAANRIARWNGSSWAALGPGMSNSAVQAIVPVGTDLYASGSFTNVGGQFIRAVARWNGTNWSSLGDGLTSVGASATEMVTDGTNVFVGGIINSAGHKPSYYLARWNTQTNYDPPASLAITPLSPRADGLPEFRLDAVSVTDFIIQTSTNLADSWAPFKTNFVTPCFFLETNFDAFSRRYYRAVPAL